MMMDHSSRNRKLIFGLMFAMIGMRLLIFALDVSGIIVWGSSLGVSALSWILPVGMPVAIISAMLLLGRKRMPPHPQTPQDSRPVPLTEILRERLARGRDLRRAVRGDEENPRRRAAYQELALFR